MDTHTHGTGLAASPLSTTLDHVEDVDDRQRGGIMNIWWMRSELSVMVMSFFEKSNKL